MQRWLSTAQKTLRKLRIYVAFSLLLVAIVLAIFLYDIDSLYAFRLLKGGRFYAFIKSLRLDASDLQGWARRFLSCYLIDALWFSSFLLLLSCIWTSHHILRYTMAFCFALFTEMLQLLIKNLGTFDIYDVLLYTIITSIFLLSPPYR